MFCANVLLSFTLQAHMLLVTEELLEHDVASHKQVVVLQVAPVEQSAVESQVMTQLLFAVVAVVLQVPG